MPRRQFSHPYACCAASCLYIYPCTGASPDRRKQAGMRTCSRRSPASNAACRSTSLPSCPCAGSALVLGPGPASPLSAVWPPARLRRSRSIWASLWPICCSMEPACMSPPGSLRVDTVAGYGWADAVDCMQPAVHMRDRRGAVVLGLFRPRERRLTDEAQTMVANRCLALVLHVLCRSLRRQGGGCSASARCTLLASCSCYCICALAECLPAGVP